MVPLLFVLTSLHLTRSQSYIEQDETLTFHNSDFLCAFSYDTQLASIHNNDENDQAQLECSDKCWIGFTDANTEGIYVWTDGSSTDYGVPIGLGSHPWHSGEPNQLAPQEDCIEMDNLGWNDAFCTNNLPSLCNYPMPIYSYNDNTNYQRIPVQSTVIGTMDILDEIIVDFDIRINSFIAGNGNANILHIGNTNGIALPSIFINESVSKLYFVVGTLALGYNYVLSDIIALNTWYHISVYIKMDNLNITVNDSVICDQTIASHQILKNQNIYLSDPWTVPSSDATLSGLVISTSNSHDPAKGGAYNYLCDYQNRFTEKSGNWSIDASSCVLTKENMGPNAIWLGESDISSKSWVDYKVELVYEIHSGEDGGLMLRASSVGGNNNEGQYYKIHLHIPNKNLIFAKVENNNFIKLHNYTIPSLNYDIEYKLRVEAYQNIFYIFFQNSFLFSVDDSSFMSGSIGIRDYFSSATYKSLRITFPTDNYLYTVDPTNAPSYLPSLSPTKSPSNFPTLTPTDVPSNLPSQPPNVPSDSPLHAQEGGITDTISTAANIPNQSQSNTKTNTDEILYILVSVVSLLFLITCILVGVIYCKRKKENINIVQKDLMSKEVGKVTPFAMKELPKQIEMKSETNELVECSSKDSNEDLFGTLEPVNNTIGETAGMDNTPN